MISKTYREKKDVEQEHRVCITDTASEHEGNSSCKPYVFDERISVLNWISAFPYSLKIKK